jgi:anti-anti-sigma factor
MEGAQSSILCVSGEVNWTTSDNLSSEIGDCLLEQHPNRLIVDLNGVIRIDSAGLGALVGGLQEARKRHVQFTLCGLNASLRRLMQRTCLDRVFEIRPSVADALGDAEA